MIDIHAHILPGVDDGAQDMYDTLEMLQMSISCGVNGIVATPHCNVPGYYDNYFGEDYVSRMEALLKTVRNERLPIQVYPGMEVFATEELPKLLRDGRIMTLNQSHYLLMEFGFREDPAFADFVLNKVRSLGVIPVIAHVERYEFIQDDPEMILKWSSLGDVIQVNKGSLFGRFGPDEEDTAHRLLRHNLVNVIASDAHSPFRRTTHMEDAFTNVSVIYGVQVAEMLFTTNPGNICRDQSISRMRPIPFQHYEEDFFAERNLLGVSF